MRSFIMLLVPICSFACLCSFSKSVCEYYHFNSRERCFTDSIPEDENKKFEPVEIEASYPGGEKAWKEYVSKNMRLKSIMRKKPPVGNYTVFVQCVVDKEGNLSDFKPLSNHGYGMEEEAIRLMRESGKWIPIRQNGRNVKGYRKQPFTFTIPSR